MRSLIVVPGVNENPTEGPAVGPKRIQLSGSPGPGNCLLRTPLAVQPDCKREVRMSVIRLQLKRPLVFSFGITPPELLLIYVCQLGVRFGKLWINFQRFLRRADHF